MQKNVLYYPRTKLQHKINRKEAWPIQAPQIFHDKPEKSKNFVSYPADLFAAINQICNGNEAKVLLTLLGCKGDGSFAPSTSYVQRMSGITQPNNYYRARKALEKKGLIRIDQEGNLYISTKKILSKASENLAQAKEQEAEKKKEKEPSAGQS